MSRQCSDVLGAVRGAIESDLRQVRRSEGRPLSVLDVGCWDGATTERYRDILGGSAFGVEVFPDQAARARERGVEVAEVDLESAPFPWPDGSMNVVVVNQVFEHLKNIWTPMSEIARVLAPGGYLVFSVPNLASLHNRIMLGLGLQPSSIRTFGPHIRGFTLRQARQFVELEDFFSVLRISGVGFYPLPAAIAGPFARLWAGASHTPIILARRIAPADTTPPWQHASGSHSVGEQTFYRNALQMAATTTAETH